MLNNHTFNIFTAMFIFAVLMFAFGARAVFSDNGQLSSSSASTTDSFNFSPDNLFQKLRNFISIEVSIFNPKDMINNTFTGFNEGIRDITGVDIVKFFGFITSLFYKAFLWLTELLQNFKSG